MRDEGYWRDEMVAALVRAVDQAHACREASVVDAVCQWCWADVEVAFEAVSKAYKPKVTEIR